jgi:hypothetical protein
MIVAAGAEPVARRERARWDAIVTVGDGVSCEAPTSQSVTSDDTLSVRSFLASLGG